MGKLLGFLRMLIMACYLQSGIQTQLKIWDVVFYENDWRVVPVNNFCKKNHLKFYFRISKFDSDLKHSDKEYIQLNIYIYIYYIWNIKEVLYKKEKQQKWFYWKRVSFQSTYDVIIKSILHNERWDNYELYFMCFYFLYIRTPR